jgi:acyl-CoA dehydrogenase
MDQIGELYFDQEHLALRSTVRQFVKNELPPELVRKIDQDQDGTRFPFIIRDKLKPLGLTAIGIPAEYGGSAMSLRSFVVAMEELAKATPAACFVAGLMGPWGGVPIATWGTKEQQDFFLPKIAAGDLIFSIAMTESGGGSDLLGNIRTTASVDGDSYVINGEKVFITGAHVCDYMIVLALTDRDNQKRSERFSLILVDAKNTPGIRVEPIHKMVIRPVGANIVSFDEVRVPRKNLLGPPNQGFKLLLGLMTAHKLVSAADALGVAQAAYAEALAYSKERRAFGQPIGQFQLVQRYLVDMETEIRAAKHLTYHSAWLADKDRSFYKECIVAERYASDMAFKTATRAMELFGGYGLTTDYNLERYFRDSRQFVTTPFTNEIAICQIAEALGLPSSYQR